MKKIILSLFTIFAIAAPANGFAQETGEYKSNAQTGFYGTYEYPEESSQQQISGPEEQTNDQKPASKEQTNGQKAAEQQTKHKSLPTTGSKQLRGVRLLGILLILAAGIVIFLKRREENEKKHSTNGKSGIN